jgi:hypothetical protein
MSEIINLNFEQIGQKILEGKKLKDITLNGKKYVFNPAQKDFIFDWKSDYCLSYGGFGSGKSLALYIKMYLFCMCFPKNTVLFGRKTLADITKANLKDFFDLIPEGSYEHKIKDSLINFSNGSQIILFGLDAMQGGSEADIKKAEQKIKSINLGAYFIDQLEEIEYSVFDALNSRLRNIVMPFGQGNMTSNVANYWAYHYFIRGLNKSGDNWVERKPVMVNGKLREIKTAVFKSSTRENERNLQEDYIGRQLAGHDEKWIERYYEGNWTADLLSHRQVFGGYSTQWIARQPIAKENGCEIYEEPFRNKMYQIGIDPSEGVVDPASITVVSEDGKKVAKFNGKIPIGGLTDKVRHLYYKYGRPKIILEVNDKAGGALLENIKDLNVARRETFDYKEKRIVEKLGFKTNHQTKRMLIDNFQQLMKDGFPKIFDRNTIEEFSHFVWSDEAKHQGAAAQKDFHDDDVLSTLLAFWNFTPKKIEVIQVAQAMQAIKKKKIFQYK